MKAKARRRVDAGENHTMQRYGTHLPAPRALQRGQGAVVRQRLARQAVELHQPQKLHRAFPAPARGAGVDRPRVAALVLRAGVCQSGRV